MSSLTFKVQFNKILYRFLDSFQGARSGPSRIQEFRITPCDLPLLQRQHGASLVDSHVWDAMVDCFGELSSQREAAANVTSSTATSVDECVDCLFDWCSRKELWILPKFNASPPETVTVLGNGLRIVFDVSGWTSKIDDEFIRFAATPHGIAFDFDFVCGPDERDDLEQLMVPGMSVDDDRRFYRALRKYADQHAQVLSHKVTGVHLFFWQEQSGLSMTFFNHVMDCWSRKYALFTNVPDRGGHEFVLTFHVYGSWEQFLRLTPEMERVANELKVSFGPLGKVVVRRESDEIASVSEIDDKIVLDNDAQRLVEQYRLDYDTGKAGHSEAAAAQLLAVVARRHKDIRALIHELATNEFAKNSKARQIDAASRLLADVAPNIGVTPFACLFRNHKAMVVVVQYLDQLGPYDGREQ